MPRRKLSMRKIKEVLRLLWDCHQNTRAVAASVRVSPSTVLDYKYRAHAAGLVWPLPVDLDDVELERLLFPPQSAFKDVERTLPDWAYVYKEMKSHKGNTLQLLWHEYKSSNPEGYQYSRFCELFREWQGSLSIAMRQEYVAGEKLFVDYAGTTIPVWDAEAKCVRNAQLFIGALGASSLVFADVTWTQTLPDWIGSHVRMYEFLDGVTEIIVPDNLKSGVKTPCFYDPDINPTYLAMAQHYGTVVIPARIKKPKDKPKAEQSVQLATRWILAPLRKRTFLCLSALRKAVSERLEIINNKTMRQIGKSRRELFNEIEKAALKPLPATRYEYAEYKKARVHIDYHVEVEGHYYSAPFQLRRKEVDAWSTSTTVEIFFGGSRVASHKKSSLKGRHTTLNEHMPPNHRAYKEWSPERFRSWGASIGNNAAIFVDRVFEKRTHPAQAFRLCLGVLSLAKKYGAARLDAACERALTANSVVYRTIKHVLEKGLDKRKEKEPTKTNVPVNHANVRGAAYYAAAPITELGSEEPSHERKVN